MPLCNRLIILYFMCPRNPKEPYPALGVFFKAERPTLGDGLDEIVDRAQQEEEAKHRRPLAMRA